MGRERRDPPARLAEKLRFIREYLGLSQNEMISRMRLAGELKQDAISRFESGEREPSSKTLLAYARAASRPGEEGKVLVALIDDGLDLRLLKQRRAEVRFPKSVRKAKTASRKR